MIENTDSTQIEKIMLEAKDFRDKIPDQETNMVSFSTSSKVLDMEMLADRQPSSTDEAAISIKTDKMVELPKFEANGGTKHENQQKTICSEDDKMAVARLFEICATNNWVAPKFVLCKVDGLIHQRRFTYKVKVEIENISSTHLESFSEPRSQKTDAREHAAEGAIWLLKHLGHT